MKPIVTVLVLVAAVVAGVWLYLATDGLAPLRSNDVTASRATLVEFCIDCHNDAEFTGGVSFERADLDAVHANADVWEKAVRKLQAGLMPPAGEPRPGDGRLDDLRVWLTSALDAGAEADPNPGAPALHRLNRTEYGNAIRDLLDLDIDVATMLPADDSRDGFDNVADALSVSPAHMQAYVAAAAAISRLAIGDLGASAAIVTYNVPRGLSQAGHLDGLPFGTRGGLAVEHDFPVDAEYELSVRRAVGGIFLDSVGNDDPVELAIDDQPIDSFTGRGGRPVRLPVSAGPHRLTAAVTPVSREYGVDDLYSNLAAATGVTSISIAGPFAASGPGDTPSRRRVLVCQPRDPTDRAEARACGERVVTTLVRRAFRRPVERLADSVETVMRFYDEGFDLGGFDLGIQHALARVLVDPRFLFRFEYEPDDLAGGAVYPVDDHALATRLSFFLWSSIPDDRLLDLADAGRLREPDVLRGEVARMLRDPKSISLAGNFAAQWLGLRELATINPVAADFDANLRQAFVRETEMLFADIVARDASVVDLLTADYTFVDERLARHYGIPNVRGSRFRRVELTDESRFGLLGHGSILTVTSPTTRTSPVSRGKWVLENLLGTPPPAPPPNVERNLDQPTPAGEAPLSLRARLERHRSDPTCASCHRIIDPVGFALESFDLTGRSRETDRGLPIDTSGELWDGTPISGPASLRAALVSRRELFVQALTEKLLTFALGRALESYDMPVVRRIVTGAAGADYRFSALVDGIVESVPFRMKRKPEAGEADGLVAAGD